jgi:hypothetical protein
MRQWHDKNLGKSPFDPDFDDTYNAEEDRERYDLEQELRAMAREGN